MKIGLHPGRAVLGGAVGALWACGVILLPVSISVKLAFTSVVIPAFMVFLALGVKKPGEIFRGTAGLYLTAVLAAGGLELAKGSADKICSFLSRGKSAFSESRRLSLYGMFFMAGAVFFFICFLWEMAGEEKRHRRHMAAVSVFYKGRQVRVKAFLDTGNRLSDPVFHRPVSVIWAGALDGIFDEAPGMMMIPYRSVGKEGGLLPAVKADMIYMELDGKAGKLRNPLIAISSTPLSADGSYEMLLHEEFWEKAVKTAKEKEGEINGD